MEWLCHSHHHHRHHLVSRTCVQNIPRRKQNSWKNRNDSKNYYLDGKNHFSSFLFFLFPFSNAISLTFMGIACTDLGDGDGDGDDDDGELLSGLEYRKPYQKCNPIMIWWYNNTTQLDDDCVHAMRCEKVNWASGMYSLPIFYYRFPHYYYKPLAVHSQWFLLLWLWLLGSAIIIIIIIIIILRFSSLSPFSPGRKWLRVVRKFLEMMIMMHREDHFSWRYQLRESCCEWVSEWEREW